MLHSETSHFSSVVHPVLTSTPSTTATTATTSLSNGPLHHIHSQQHHPEHTADSSESPTTPKLSSVCDTPDSGTMIGCFEVNRNFISLVIIPCGQHTCDMVIAFFRIHSGKVSKLSVSSLYHVL